MCRELNWTENTKLTADAMLVDAVKNRRPITSLDFKLELRRRVGTSEQITQEDVGYYLRETFLRERFADSEYQAQQRWLDSSNWHYVYEPMMEPDIIGLATPEEMNGEAEETEISAS